MTRPIVLESLAELEGFRDRFPVDASQALVPVATDVTSRERIDRIAEIAARAIEELGALEAEERARRASVEEALARAGRLREQAARLESLSAAVGRAASGATFLANAALDEQSGRRAQDVAARCGRLATEADVRRERLLAEATALEADPAVARVMAQETKREDERRSQETLRRVEDLMNDGAYKEARSLLNLLAEQSSGPDLSETFETLGRREQAVNTQTAEGALRAARRCYRHDPVQALDLLEPLELDHVIPEIARHVYGLWLQVCRRLGLVAAIHYTPAFGRGAVLMPAADGSWEVVSAIGLRGWPRGRRVSPRSLRGARPLS